LDASFSWKNVEHRKPLILKALKGALSASYVPSETDATFNKMMEMFECLFATCEEKGKIQILYDTKQFYEQI
jgi:hypothetical protein